MPDQHQHKSLLGSIKEALRPGDSKKQEHMNDARQQQSPRHAGDFTHDGRHGGIEEVMKRGHRDYDESEEGPQSHVDGMRTDGGGGGGMLDSAMPGRKGRDGKEPGSVSGMFGSWSAGSSGGGSGSADRVSAFDREGAVGHQFTVSNGCTGV